MKHKNTLWLMQPFSQRHRLYVVIRLRHCLCTDITSQIRLVSYRLLDRCMFGRALKKCSLRAIHNSRGEKDLIKANLQHTQVLALTPVSITKVFFLLQSNPTPDINIHCLNLSFWGVYFNYNNLPQININRNCNNNSSSNKAPNCNCLVVWQCKMIMKKHRCCDKPDWESISFGFIFSHTCCCCCCCCCLKEKVDVVNGTTTLFLSILLLNSSFYKKLILK